MSARLVTGVAVLALFASLPAHAGRVVFPQDVPAEVGRITQEAWSSFLDVFRARRDCIAPVTVVLVRDLAEDADAKYSRTDEVITVLIPTSPRRYPEALVHELAHHLDNTCAAVRELRPRVLAAQGFGPATPWTSGETWETIPAEQFAEAVVQAVRGERIVHADRIRVSVEAVDAITAWGSEIG